MKRAIVLAALVTLLASGVALADKSAPILAYALVSGQSANNVYSPPWCLNEDDYDYRKWTGSFAGGVTATEYFCTPLVDVYNGYDQWDGGNTGFKAWVTAAGTLTSMTLSNPGGVYNPSFTQNAVLTASKTVGHGHNAYVLNTYMVCIFTGTTSFPWGPLTGTWTMTLNGAFSQATLEVQASISGGPPECPAGQQR